MNIKEQKKKNKHVILFLAIGFAILVCIIIIYIIINYISDQNAIKKEVEEVETSYEAFKNHMNTFNEKREEIYDDIIKVTYYQQLKEQDGTFKQLFQEYEKVIADLDQDYKALEGKCINRLYPDVSANNKCEAFVVGYEEAINTYVYDIELYNQKVDDYNEWLISNNSEEAPLEEITTDKDYIDVDGDRVYRGKEEIEDGELQNETEEE